MIQQNNRKRIESYDRILNNPNLVQSLGRKICISVLFGELEMIMKE